MIRGLQKTTLVDYPGKLACTIFIGGCNMRCGYCHNSALVLKPGSLPPISHKEVLGFLWKRKNFLDGVCITGGEPALYTGLGELCGRIKKLGLSVKLDTNGTNPETLERLLHEKLVDYIAMDVKASPENYAGVAGAKVNMRAIEKSIRIIKESGTEYEFRTTLVPDVIDEDEIRGIGELISVAEKYFLQQFRPAPSTIGERYRSMEPLPKEKVLEFRRIVEGFAKKVEVRNL